MEHWVKFVNGDMERIMEWLTLSVPPKLKNSIFEIPKFPYTLNISNERTTSANSINLYIIRKLTEYSPKKSVKLTSNLTVFEI